MSKPVRQLREILFPKNGLIIGALVEARMRSQFWMTEAPGLRAWITVKTKKPNLIAEVRLVDY